MGALGKDFAAVLELLQGETKAEQVSGVRVAADYLKNNAKSIAKDQVGARQMLAEVRRSSAELKVDVGPALSVLEKAINIEAEAQAERLGLNQKTESRVDMARERIKEEAVNEAEYSFEQADILFPALKSKRPKAFAEATAKLPGWKAAIKSWKEKAPEILTHPKVRRFTEKVDDVDAEHLRQEIMQP